MFATGSKVRCAAQTEMRSIYPITLPEVGREYTVRDGGETVLLTEIENAPWLFSDGRLAEPRVSADAFVAA